MDARYIFGSKYLVKRIMGQITEKFQYLSVEDVRKKSLPENLWAEKLSEFWKI